MGVRLGEASLFCSGVFAGGAVDHAILALKGGEQTPYGVRAGVGGNWAFAAVDAVLAVGAYVLYRRITP